MAMKVSATVKETVKKQIDFGKATNFMRDHQAMVGIPQESGGRAGGVGNAELLYIHTNGSPAKGIPARPVVEPAIEQPAVLDQIADLLMEAAVASLDGNIGLAKSNLDKAGLAGENATKEYFTGANDWTPNKPATIAAKGSDRPLIDTGALRQAITHVVKEK